MALKSLRRVWTISAISRSPAGLSRRRCLVPKVCPHTTIDRARGPGACPYLVKDVPVAQRDTRRHRAGELAPAARMFDASALTPHLNDRERPRRSRDQLSLQAHHLPLLRAPPCP